MLELHEKSPDSQDSSQGINSLGYSQFHHYSENGIYCQDAVSYYFAQCLFLLFHANDTISKGISPLTYLFFCHSHLTFYADFTTGNYDFCCSCFFSSNHTSFTYSCHLGILGFVSNFCCTGNRIYNRF